MTATVRIVGGRVLTPDRFGPATVEISGDTIESVTAASSDASDGSDTVEVIDGSGLVVSPGFVDLQVNGGFGIDLVGDPLAMWDLGRQLPRHGVTAFLPTIVSSPPATAAAALDAIGRRPADHRGAEPLGIHFEGPMLSPRRPGAHRVDLLRPPSLDVIEHWSRSDGVVLVTMAPELPDAATVIAELVGRGVTVAAGHTDADASEARAGLEAGITMVTHLFNAMAPLGHRSPNLVGVALASAELSVGLIADGIHVDPVVVAAVWKAKGPYGVALVSDAVAPLGLGPGRYDLAGTTIIADDQCVRTTTGTLAGSILTMDRAVRNLTAYTGCPVDEALVAATTTPADLVGQGRRGRIAAGARADLVLLDEHLEVQITLCDGRPVHVAETARARIRNQHPEAP